MHFLTFISLALIYIYENNNKNGFILHKISEQLWYKPSNNIILIVYSYVRIIINSMLLV